MSSEGEKIEYCSKCEGKMISLIHLAHGIGVWRQDMSETFHGWLSTRSWLNYLSLIWFSKKIKSEGVVQLNSKFLETLCLERLISLKISILNL